MNTTLTDPSLRHRIRTASSADVVLPRRPQPRATRRLRVGHALYRWSRSGMELQLAAQLGCTDPRRVSAWIASSRPAEPQVPPLAPHVTMRAYDAAPRGFVAWLADRLRVTATDVVHARGLWMLPPALCAARRAGGLPVVFSFHGFDDASTNVSWMIRQRWRDALHHCAAIVTVCDAARAAFARAMEIAPERIELIANGVDTEYFQPTPDRRAARARLGLCENRPVLLCVGSLLAVKGQDVLIDALATPTPDPHEGNVRCAALSGLQLVFVGADHLHGALQRRAAERLPDFDVRFVGAVDDVRPWYTAADALVAPSRSEGLSNAIMEAMACGLPVIATRVGGNEELVVADETGWLAPTEHPAALAEALAEWLHHPDEAARRGSQGRKRVMNRFGVAHAADCYAALYERVLANDHAIERPSAARVPKVVPVDTRVAALGPIARGHADSVMPWPFGDARLRWYAYGRTAWWHLLTALDAGPGDNVLLPDLTCDVTVEPLAWLGIEPRFYRSDPQKPVTRDALMPHIDSSTRAVMATHYFGMPQPVSEAAAYCRRRGIPFIEDSAHGFLTRHDSRPLGGDADGLLLSFRKTIALPNGAGLLVNSSDLRARLDARPIRWPAARRDALRYWGKRLDRWTTGGRMERCVDGLRAWRRRAGGTARLPAAPRPSAGDAVDLVRCLVRPCAAAAGLIRGTDLAAESNRRREAFERLAARWRDTEMPGEPLVTRLESGWVPYAYPVRSGAVSAEVLCDQITAFGLHAEVWPKLAAIAPADVAARRWVLVRL